MTTPHAALPDRATMMALIDQIFPHLNLGLLVYHLEDADDAHSLRLAYANEAACTYTHADVRKLTGQTILEAFPRLSETELPQLYAQVVLDQHARNFGVSRYEGDGNVQPGYFSVKAFPMPYNCVGVVFENITARKQLEQMLKRQREEG